MGRNFHESAEKKWKCGERHSDSVGSNFRERAEKSERVGSDTVTVWGAISMKVQKKVKVEVWGATQWQCGEQFPWKGRKSWRPLFTDMFPFTSCCTFLERLLCKLSLLSEQEHTRILASRNYLSWWQLWDLFACACSAKSNFERNGTLMCNDLSLS